MYSIEDSQEGETNTIAEEAPPGPSPFVLDDMFVLEQPEEPAAPPEPDNRAAMVRERFGAILRNPWGSHQQLKDSLHSELKATLDDALAGPAGLGDATAARAFIGELLESRALTQALKVDVLSSRDSALRQLLDVSCEAAPGSPMLPRQHAAFLTLHACLAEAMDSPHLAANGKQAVFGDAARMKRALRENPAVAAMVLLAVLESTAPVADRQKVIDALGVKAYEVENALAHLNRGEAQWADALAGRIREAVQRL
jgi:hypothetical protein